MGKQKGKPKKKQYDEDSDDYQYDDEFLFTLFDDKEPTEEELPTTMTPLIDMNEPLDDNSIELSIHNGISHDKETNTEYKILSVLLLLHNIANEKELSLSG